MKISGFTIIRNAIKNDYPIVEAITSILPVVDEMIVLVGESDDDTLALIESIASNKIKIHHSVWDASLRKGGHVLAEETNKAFKLIDTNATWAFYIQADEVVHEKYHEHIKKACHQYANDKKVEGLLFNYLHFYGTYDYVGNSRKWYDHEVRIIRNDKGITSYMDAQGFRRGEQKLNVKSIDAFVYHYGWVKPPEKMKAKLKDVYKYWLENEQYSTALEKLDHFNFNDFDSIALFKETHPACMQPRIAAKNWQVQLDVTQKRLSLKNKLLIFMERLTGVKLFSFKNYKKI